MKQDSRRF